MSDKLSTRSNNLDRLFYICLNFIMLFILIITVYPFLNVTAISFNDSLDTVRGGIYVWPRVFTLKNYSTIFQYDTLLTGFVNTSLRTVLGTILGVLSASLVAYTLSCREFQARKLFSRLFIFTMYVSGGLIPFYLLIRDLHMFDTFAVYIVPGLLGVFNVFVIRSYIDGLPYALQESAKIEGANELLIFFKIIIPLCKPVLATIALFIAVGHWNSWFDTYLYNSNDDSLTTLQYELMKIIQSSQQGRDAATAYSGKTTSEIMAQVSPESIKMAITIVVTVPILLVYPFLQKYFVQGVTLGAVKS